jgi:exopolysaccharide production protein ExoQ
MSHHDLLTTETSPRAGAPPWLLFVFLTLVFFYIYHDLPLAPRIAGDYNPASDQLVATVSQGHDARRVALFSLAAVAIGILVRHPSDRRLTLLSPLGWVVLAFPVWALLSALWAEDLSLNLTRLAGFAILCIAALAVVQRLTLREVILWSFFSTAIYLCIGLFLELLYGTLQPFTPGYRFAGSLHPNGQGINCGILLLSAIAAADLGKRWRKFCWSVAFVAFVFLLLSGSRTALAAVALSALTYLVAVRSRRTTLAMASCASMLVCFLLSLAGAGFIPGLKDAILLGRDDPESVDTFAGRTAIWADVGPYIRQSPILGYGYSGFWTPAHINAISDLEEWGVGNGHSAYIDYLLTLGAVGLLAYILGLVFGIVRAFRCYKLSQSSDYAFCGAILVFCTIDSVFESGIADPSLLMFLWMVILIWLGFVPLQPHLRVSDTSSSTLGQAVTASTYF